LWLLTGPALEAQFTSDREPPGPSSRRTGLAITEIMYNPISGDTDDEYVEIYNRSSVPMNLSGWEFVVGITYNFPTNSATTSMPPVLPGATSGLSAGFPADFRALWRYDQQ
jgi:hypothetical protein